MGATRDDAVRIEYEVNNTRRTVEYSLNGNVLTRTQYTRTLPNPDVQDNSDDILTNVRLLDFTYGVDGTEGLSETQDGMMDAGGWITAANVGNRHVIAVRVDLEADPIMVDPDLQKTVSPRGLTSIVTLRNQCLIR
jgi:hypothetical protein